MLQDAQQQVGKLEQFPKRRRERCRSSRLPVFLLLIDDDQNDQHNGDPADDPII
jgi:hypothetical protein